MNGKYTPNNPIIEEVRREAESVFESENPVMNDVGKCGIRGGWVNVILKENTAGLPNVTLSQRMRKK